MNVKKLMLLQFAFCWMVFSCSDPQGEFKQKKEDVQKNSVLPLVSTKQYGELSTLEQKVTISLTGMIASMEKMTAFDTKKSYSAVTTMEEKNGEFNTENYFLVAIYADEAHNNEKRAAIDSMMGGSCIVSGFGSAVSCVKKIASAAKGKNGPLKVSVTYNNGDFHVSWE